MDTTDFLEHNYTPYSEKSSLAVVQSNDGTFYGGSRIENIAFPLSISAAQNALFCCLSEGKAPVHLQVTNWEDPLLDFWKEEFNIEISQLNPHNLPSHQFTSIHLGEAISISKMLTELLSISKVDESNFPVSALVKTELGYFTGVNIECSTWSMGLCAERVAIAKALSYGSQNLLELHIKTRDGDFTSPCGACRQVIIEHMPHNKIHLYHKDKTKSIHFSDDLLPHCFLSTSLSKSKAKQEKKSQN